MRHGFATLTPSKMQKAQMLLVELIPSVAIDSYFLHWPQNMKSKMVEEFIDNLNEAEFEYTDVVSESHGTTEITKLMEVFLRLAIRVSDLCVGGSEPNLLIIDIALTEWKEMQLGDLMDKINRTS